MYVLSGGGTGGWYNGLGGEYDFSGGCGVDLYETPGKGVGGWYNGSGEWATGVGVGLYSSSGE